MYTSVSETVKCIFILMLEQTVNISLCYWFTSFWCI